MPIGDTIGSQGLTQGGPNLGDDNSRPLPKVEQNETTNVGPSATKKDKDEDKKNDDAAIDQPPHFTTQSGDSNETGRS